MKRHVLLCCCTALLLLSSLFGCVPSVSDRESPDTEIAPRLDTEKRGADSIEGDCTACDTYFNFNAPDAGTPSVDGGIEESHCSRPNIVFIYVDDMGYSDIEPFGSTLSKTPNLNRLADEGLKLTDFYVSAIACSPSRAALLTGSYANRVDMDGSVCFPNDPKALHPDEITIAEMMRDAGYATGCFGKWHVGHEPGYMPLDQGFDEYVGIPYSNDMWTQKSGHDYPPLPLMSGQKAIATIMDGRDQALITDQVTAAALDFIRRNADRPFFAYIPYSIVHYPRFATETRAENGAYNIQRTAVEEVDSNVGRVMTTLEGLGIERNTLLFFTSDNGGLGEETTAPLRGSKAEIARYEGNVRVPTLAWWPGTIPCGTISQEIGQTIDIMPTLACLTGAKLPTDRTIDGKDISNLLLRPRVAKSPHDVLFYELTGVRKNAWKLVKRDDDIYELYNLEVDISESNDIASVHPDKVEELKALLDAHIEDVESNFRPRGEMPDLTPIPTEGLPTLSHSLGLDYLDVYPETDLLPTNADSEAVDDRDTVNSYSGEWEEQGAALCYSDTCHLGTSLGASVAFTFYGSGISWYGTMNVNLGIAYVYIDDVLAAEIDCYSLIGGAQQLFTKSDLTDGTHTIRIVRSGEKNPASSGYDIMHDYFQHFWLP